MPRKGLLIEYEYCTGCHACELACQQEHNFPQGPGGITVSEVVVQRNDKVHVDYMPALTYACDLCKARTERGEQPACVKHCQAVCIFYGDTVGLAKMMETKPRSAIFAPL